ncbi:alpha/beta fold hydrolase [Luteimonas sp. RD2P54]|uniref:Alpha/beta fold hydrolase n=1 Tax=Luteimonas endophytica TaxID=3042023 RepID=A0ABT6JDS2_9GAMM|nr:alpha/beta hydrolase [Luteimonas endophytica]MDH5824931.1 alpha/beta fold hydrolase [Luteimonas endophytica]
MAAPGSHRTFSLLDRWRRSGAALLALALCGCTSLADRIVEPRSVPLVDSALAAQVQRSLGIETGRHRPAGGPVLQYLEVAPRDYGLEYRYTRTARGAAFEFATRSRPAHGHPQPPRRGTVVLLHGWGLDSSSMLVWALHLAEAGWQGIAVDLRNHGGSGRAPAGYGPREGEDVAGLVRTLLGNGTIREPVFLLGVSYGAVAALHAAADPQAPVAGVVAFSPYANAAEGIADMVRGLATMHGESLRVRLAAGLGRYDAARTASAIAEAGRRLELDLAAIDVRRPVAAGDACMLMVHGDADGFFAMEDVRSLADASARAHLLELPGEHHFSLPMRADWLAMPVAEWMATAAAGECRPATLPAPPGVPAP